MSEPFRTAAAPVAEPAIEKKPATEIKASSPSVAETNAEATANAPGSSDKTPFVAEYLDIANVWQKQKELKVDVEQIQGFLRTQVADGKLESSDKAAKLYLAEMEKKAGTHPYESVNQRITKILAYIQFRKVVDG